MQGVPVAAEVVLQCLEGGLPLGEAAAYFGISERTLRERIKQGKVRAVKVLGPSGGAAYRVFLDELPPGARTDQSDAEARQQRITLELPRVA